MRILSRAKQGDKVIVDDDALYNHVAVIRRTTKTLIILENGLRFMKSSGREYGCHYNPDLIVPWTKRGENEIHNQRIQYRLVNKIKDIDLWNIDLKRLKRIAKILNINDSPMT